MIHTVYMSRLCADAPAHQVAARMISKEQREVSVVVGETLTIECMASGWPVPNVTWSRYGGQLSRRHHQHNGRLFTSVADFVFISFSLLHI